MTPAQRRKRRSKRRANKKKNSSGIIKVVIAGLLLLFAYLLITFTTKYWDGERKLAVAVSHKNGDVSVLNLDPATESITSVKIPGDTQVLVARQLGTWRLKSVWNLGEDEGLSGRLLSETITKQFNLPVYVWAEEKALAFSTGEFIELVKAVTSPYSTNLGLGDRLKIALFSFGVKNFKREEINLADTSTLEKKNLVDGEEGYIVKGNPSSSILANFSQPIISNRSSKLKIIDATGKNGVAEGLGEILEVLGVKVASISQVKEEDLDCIISGKDEEAVDIIKNLYLCKEEDLGEDNFEVVVKIGKDFSERF